MVFFSARYRLIWTKCYRLVNIRFTRYKTNKKALTVAFESRGKLTGLAFYSDQGVQYTSQAFRQLLWCYQVTKALVGAEIVGKVCLCLWV